MPIEELYTASLPEDMLDTGWNDGEEDDDDDESYYDDLYDGSEEEVEDEYADPNDKYVKTIELPIWDCKIDIYPLEKGQTFRAIWTTLPKGGGRFIIESQEDIEEIRTYLNEIEKINKPVPPPQQPEPPKKKFNRFSEIEMV
jgi:hypothetical protein